jgi:hypothetical protein
LHLKNKEDIMYLKGLGEQVVLDYVMLAELAKQAAMAKCPTVVTGLSDETVMSIVKGVFADFSDTGTKTLDEYIAEAGDALCGKTKTDSNGTDTTPLVIPKGKLIIIGVSILFIGAVSYWVIKNN